MKSIRNSARRYTSQFGTGQRILSAARLSAPENNDFWTSNYSFVIQRKSIRAAASEVLPLRALIIEF